MLFSTRLLSIFTASIFLVACEPVSRHHQSTGDLSAGIINGVPVQKNDVIYKMTARILVNVKNVWHPFCTASILSEDLILTAAHCVEDTNVQRIRVAFDAQPLSFSQQNNPKTRVDVLSLFQTIEVSDLVTHPDYGSVDYEHDMALLKLKNPVPKGFFSVSLLTLDQMNEIKENVDYPILLAGFGMVSEDPREDSEILRKTDVTGRFAGRILITDQTKGSGGCHGDSGGPAYLEINQKLVLVGVTHGPKLENPDCHHQGVWGNPNQEKQFLNEAAEKLGSPVRF